MKVGFTGTRQGLTPTQRNVLRAELANLPAEIFIHGGCVGADDEADKVAVELGLERRVLPGPAGPSRVPDARLVWRAAGYKHGTTITICPPQHPLKRNKQIVAESDVLIACPAQDTEVLRSGTWMTVRAARKAGKRVILIGPGGIR